VAGKIFISYRRDDSAANALGISQYLENAFGQRNVFIDVDMRAGAKFPVVLEERLAACKVMLVLIGIGWINAQDDEGRRRLDNPDDWVRLEIARALKRGITVIPVRVGAAELPKRAILPEDIQGLLDNQATSVTNDGFRNDMAGLVRDIRAMPDPARWERIGGITAGLLILLLAAWVELSHIGAVAWGPAKIIEGFARLFEKSENPNQNATQIAAPGLRRSEFNEWTMYEFSIDQTSKQKFAQFFKLSTLEQFGDKVAVMTRYPADPSKPLPGITFAEGDYGQDTIVIDCKSPAMAIAEKTLYAETGDVKYHFRWGDPKYLTNSMGMEIHPGSVAQTAQHILCNEELRTPLVSKSDLLAMNFTPLATTADGRADMFYGPINFGTGSLYPNERTVVIKEHEDHELFPGQTVIGVPPSYRTIVEQAQVDCGDSKVSFAKQEYYDASNNLVSLSAPITLVQLNIVPSSPIGLLQRIVCSDN
jgi:hypothetical protein